MTRLAAVLLETTGNLPTAGLRIISGVQTRVTAEARAGVAPVKHSRLSSDLTNPSLNHTSPVRWSIQDFLSLERNHIRQVSFSSGFPRLLPRSSHNFSQCSPTAISSTWALSVFLKRRHRCLSRKVQKRCKGSHQDRQHNLYVLPIETGQHALSKFS